MQEYLSNNLASDSEDEKHIAHSRKAAAAKRKKTNRINSDESDTGYGGFLIEHLGKKLSSGNFPTALRNTSSTQCKLVTVKFVLDSFGPSINHQRVKWFTDNQNTE